MNGDAAPPPGTRSNPNNMARREIVSYALTPIDVTVAFCPTRRWLEMRVKRTHTLHGWSMRIGRELWPRLLVNSAVEPWFLQLIA